MAAEATTTERSVFQSKYEEFIEDVRGALPEYGVALDAARALTDAERLQAFQEQVRAHSALQHGTVEDTTTNPNMILPGVALTDEVWSSLSESSRHAIWEHVRVVSICCFLEAGFQGDNNETRPAWMDEAMDEMKRKLEHTDFSAMIGKFMNFFRSMGGSTSAATDDATDDATTTADQKAPEMGDAAEKLFASGFPKMPERFLKGHMARLAQEIVREIKPDDLGITPDKIKQCEKDPSKAFGILFDTFVSDPTIIQRTISKIGNRLQQKVQSGAIQPAQIAREAEELMKEFTDNQPFVEMMQGIKAAFGFEDMDTARSVGKEGSARLSLARERLRKKLENKKKNPFL